MTVLSGAAFSTGQSSANVQYIIAGPDLDTLTHAAEAALIEVRKFPASAMWTVPSSTANPKSPPPWTAARPERWA